MARPVFVELLTSEKLTIVIWLYSCFKEFSSNSVIAEVSMKP